MARYSDAPTPPEGVPEHVASELAELDPEALRKTIIHARELLQYHSDTESQIEPGPGEDILRVTEHDEYTEVVKQVFCSDGCDDCPHGPYLYHVTEEPQLDGEDRLHWSFIGQVRSDDE